MFYPKEEEFNHLWEKYEMIPVYKEIVSDIFTPSLFLVAHYEKPYLFLLESANLKKNFSRFTFFGFPEEVHELESVNPFDFIKKNIPWVAPSFKDFGDFSGGFVGLLGYGSSNYTGILRKKIREGKDLALFMKVNKFFVLDNFKQKLFACYILNRKDSPPEDYRRAKTILKDMERELFSFSLTASSTSPSNFQVSFEFTKEEFEERVRCIKAEIEKGEAIQVVFSQKVTIEADNISPLSFYRMLRRINPSPYLFFLKFNDVVFCGSSPEVHLKIKNNKAYMKPIAGTYPVGEDMERIIAELKRDEKERAEHLMLVDLVRNDMYTYCLPESVKVPKFMEAEVYSHVIHLVSSVTGVLKDKVSGVDLLRMTFPAGTVSGAPKVRAQELIDEYEISPRDFYAGCVGYFSYNGSMDTCITIRSAKFERKRAILRAGAGIVYDSVPEREYFEVTNKLKALMEAMKRSHEVEVHDAAFIG